MKKETLFTKIILLNVILFFTFSLSSQEIITVSENGVYKTLEDAYSQIEVNSENKITKSYIIELLGESVDVNINSTSIKWLKSGTKEYSIKIISNSNTVVNKEFPHRPAIKLQDVQNIHFRGITFNNAKFGIRLVNADSCSISYCKFLVTNYGNDNANGGGAIELSGNCPDNSLISDCTTSDNNTISNNFIRLTEEAFQEIGSPKSRAWHGIYLSNSTNNTVKYNTIDNAFGNGIHIWHEKVLNNNIKNNFSNLTISASDTLRARHNILIGKNWNWGYNNASVSGNIIVDNYINKDLSESISTLRVNTGYESFSEISNLNNLVIHNKLTEEEGDDKNTATNNVELFYDFDGKKAIDPLYFKENLDIIATLSGDFDGDGKKNEIAAFVKTGTNSSKIVLWKRDKIQGKYFLNFLGTWWESNRFDATQIKDRLVVGDFTGDKRTDIAGFRDLCNNNSSIVVFASSSQGKFKPDGYGYEWWKSNDFNANQLTGRLVAGDFNGDGNSDIAGFRDLGNNNSSIVVFTSSQGEFNPDGDDNFEWWRSNNFDANQITGRLVTNDFTDDGRVDIAGLRDLGNNNSSIVVFATSSQKKFKPDGYGYNWWESSTGSFDANQVLSILDLNIHLENENVIPDILAFRSLGNRYRTIGWYNTSPKFRNTNELGIPWLIGNENNTIAVALNHKVDNQNIIEKEKHDSNSLFLRNYPNPFNDETTIQFETVSEGIVEINVYFTSGQLAKKILNKKMKPGIYTMNLNFNKFDDGLYFLELINGGQKKYHKILYIIK